MKRCKLIVFIMLLSMVLSACGTQGAKIESGDNTEDSASSISILFAASDGEYIPNAYKYGTDEAHETPYESLEEAEAKGKIILTMMAGAGNHEVGVTANAFNCANDKYHVEIDEYDNAEMRERQERLKIEIVAGKGPDIMTMYDIPDASKLMSKGCFVDLAPLLVQSGYTEDMFFPCFKTLSDGEHIYGVSFFGDIVSYGVKEDVIGGREVPSFEAFVDDLLNYPGNAIFLNEVQKPKMILRYFLEGSETLWGAIDWDSKTCDFSGELFSKILDVVKRYNDAKGKGYDPIMISRKMMPGIEPAEDHSEEYFEKNGWVTVDWWFDDGNYPKSNQAFETVMINAKTENLEGAWAFVSYYLSASGQSYGHAATNREVFDAIFKDLREVSSPEDAEKYYPQSAIDNYRDLMERGRFVPWQTEPILDIIYEETDAFFAGDKEKEAVIDLIQNRVSIYLAEMQ